MKRLLYLFLIIALASSCGKERVSVIPYPNSVKVLSGTFTATGAKFFIDADVDSRTAFAIAEFADKLSEATGVAVNSNQSCISFIVNPKLKAEAYTIKITTKKAQIEASDFNGFFYAIQTLSQLLPVEFYGGKTDSSIAWTLPCVKINDAPRFGYRAMHLDVARHFFTAQQVKKYLDMMSIHKMNTFHWHLSDDQGWRLELESFPELTEIGSRRDATVINKQWTQYDGIPHCGYYTKAEIKDIVEYAANRGITIIPEIDLPGHMLTALAAYPQLGCTGGPYKVWERWGISQDVLCIGKEGTMDFLRKLLFEIADMFPGEYFHIGGDECPKVRWHDCPDCQRLIRELGFDEKEGYSPEHYLQSYVMSKAEEFLAEKGKKIIGWDEILEGEPTASATIMSWRGTEGGIAASKVGHDVIMVPYEYLYLDYYQAKDMSREPFAIGGYNPIERIYSYEPFDQSLDAAARAHILGVQANLWTEYIATWDHIEYMLLPRQAAVSEIQWCSQSNKNWNRFAGCLPKEMKMYEELGFNYAKTYYEISGKVYTEDNIVKVKLSNVDGSPMRYTLDGTEPTLDSPIVNGPICIDGDCVLKARVYRDWIDVRDFSKSFISNKALGKNVSSENLPDPRFNDLSMLTDGVRTFYQFDSGEWTGWGSDAFSVVIDMGEDGAAYSSVTTGFLSGKDEDIFPPTIYRISLSDDGINFAEVAVSEYPLEVEIDPHRTVDLRLDFPKSSSRYIKVEAQTADELPSWHVRAKGKVYLYADEIIVD